MKSPLACLSVVGLLIGCGPPVKPPPPDAGPDTSCGLDCVAQARYGLTVGRCFEYSSTMSASDPASLGVIVKPVEKLDGEVYTLPLEYRESGQVKMSDYFLLTGGDLVLARRTFLPGQSVNYKDSDGNIVGTPWLKALSISGENFTGNSNADVVNGTAPRKSEPTAYKVTLTPPSVSEQTVPAGSFPEAFKMLLSETPDHGADPRRIFVPGTGFTLFSTSFNIIGGSAQEYRLQRIRDIGVGDAGSIECGFGSP
ncbi:MAG: hypothetical protein ACYC8T_10495 [Myxococcaceae bacterium]